MESDYQFVITPPQDYAAEVSYDNMTRNTLGVLAEIIQAADRYVVIGSPYLHGFPYKNKVIEYSLEAALNRGVQLHIVSTKGGLKKVNLKPYQSKDVWLYTPEWDNMSGLGSHAKFCLADGRLVYMGSANFTYSGLNLHLEMGVFARGEMAKQLEQFWDYMVRKGFFKHETLSDYVKSSK